MKKQERIAKLNWVLSLLVSLEEKDGMSFPQTKQDVINKIAELSC